MYYILTLNIMPDFDKTGPAGKGPMTGRGDGPCNSNSPRRGRRCGPGGGRGFGRGGGFGRNSGVGSKKDEK